MPHRHATAAILAVGDELVRGESLDTNSKWISRRLADAGVVPVEHAAVPDDEAAIAAAIGRLAGAVDLLVITGGLGPTADDLTRAGLARVLGEELVEDPDALAFVREAFARRGREMPGSSRVQALRPGSARWLANENGTAPGLFVPAAGDSGEGTDRAEPRSVARPGSPPLRGGSSVSRGCGSTDHAEPRARAEIWALPGPPAELGPMFERLVLPALRPPPGRAVRTGLIHTVGVGEADVGRVLADLMRRDANPVIGTTASAGIVTCRIRYIGPAEGADAAVAGVEREVRERLGSAVFGEDQQTLAGAVLELLRDRGEMLATVESCTGGLLGEVITQVPGASDVYVGGWVTYTNRFKTGQVGVPADVFSDHGAVSRRCAEAMAVGGLTRSGATHCVSITGIAGPGGGSPDKPVGTVWIAVASGGAGFQPALPPRPDGGGQGRPASAADSLTIDARRFQYRGGRELVRRWSAVSALAMVRQNLIGERSALVGQA